MADRSTTLDAVMRETREAFNILSNASARIYIESSNLNPTLADLSPAELAEIQRAVKAIAEAVE